MKSSSTDWYNIFKIACSPIPNNEINMNIKSSAYVRAIWFPILKLLFFLFLHTKKVWVFTIANFQEMQQKNYQNFPLKNVSYPGICLKNSRNLGKTLENLNATQDS